MIHVESMKTTLKSSEVGDTISIRECKIRLQRLKIGNSNVLQRYVDADYARDLDQRRSMMGYVFTVDECTAS